MANGHGGARPGAGRPRNPPALLPIAATADPLQFLLAVMNSPDAEIKLRIDAAKALLPFLHRRPGENGKKDEAKKAAMRAIKGKFGPGAPPLKLIR